MNPGSQSTVDDNAAPAGTRGVLSLANGSLQVDDAELPPAPDTLWGRLADDPRPVTLSDWASGGVTHANAAAQRLLGRSDQQLRHVTGRELLPDTCAPLAEVVNSILDANDAFFGTLPVATGSGVALRSTEVHALGRGDARYCVNIYGEAPETHPASADGPVLVVEDDDMVREVVGKMLQPRAVRLAADGHEALAVLLREPDIGAVVTDLQMPRVSGAQLIEVLRILRPDLVGRIIVLSGRADLSSRLVGVTVLRKPVSVHALRAELDSRFATARCD